MNIYIRLSTYCMSISGFAIQDKVTLRPLKLDFYIENVTEWSRALDTMPSDWCCSVSMMWDKIPSREEQNLTAYRSNSNTVGLIFRRTIYIYIRLKIKPNSVRIRF
jgi:hypothetical protein